MIKSILLSKAFHFVQSIIRTQLQLSTIVTSSLEVHNFQGSCWIYKVSMVAGCYVPPGSPLLYVTSFCGQDDEIKDFKIISPME